MQTNVLYYGDNLDILRAGHIPDDSIDLIYLDPPWNSNREYNVIFRDESGRRSDAQHFAFEDTWHWGPTPAATYDYLTNTGQHRGRIPSGVTSLVAALHSAIGRNQMMAYIVEMAVRLVELRRVLKPTGSLYLHCDPTASHYLKILLDAVFDPRNFRNEIVWKRTSSHNDARRFAGIHDTLLYYARSDRATWNAQYLPHAESYLRTHYSRTDAHGRRYRLDNIIRSASMGPRPNLAYEYKGFTPQWGWRVVRDKLEALDRVGRLTWTKSGVPYLVRYLDEMPGTTMPTIWDDIPPINSQAKERLGWPTQKPLALLERVIQASSDPGDVVLDPFCGCGTAIAAAQKLGRRWIGIDITYLAIDVMQDRMWDHFKIAEIPVIGEPTELEGARRLAEAGANGRYQFQWWALGLVDAHPVGGERKKGADRGVDGVLTFTDNFPNGQYGKVETVLVSVKSGHVDVSAVRDLRGAVERDRATVGLFVTLEEPSRPMRDEALAAGFYHSPLLNRKFPKVQILTIRQLLAGERADLPSHTRPPRWRAERFPEQPRGEQLQLPNPADMDQQRFLRERAARDGERRQERGQVPAETEGTPAEAAPRRRRAARG